MTSETYKLSRPTLLSLEEKMSDVKFMPASVKKKLTGKMQYPEITSKIYTRKRIINVKEEARKSRYMLKTHRGEFGNNSSMFFSPDDSMITSKVDFNEAFNK